jgi:hypothetical protein
MAGRAGDEAGSVVDREVVADEPAGDVGARGKV